LTLIVNPVRHTLTTVIMSNYPDGTYGYGYGTANTAYDTTAGTSYGVTAPSYGTTGDVNRTSYDPSTGAYDQHLDYDTDGTRRHHREQTGASGRYYHRDVDRDTTGYDGGTRVHKEYVNPNTGTSYRKDSQYAM
jgi:hypothetical protein